MFPPLGGYVYTYAGLSVLPGCKGLRVLGWSKGLQTGAEISRAPLRVAQHPEGLQRHALVTLLLWPRVRVRWAGQRQYETGCNSRHGSSLPHTPRRQRVQLSCSLRADAVCSLLLLPRPPQTKGVKHDRMTSEAVALSPFCEGVIHLFSSSFVRFFPFLSFRGGCLCSFTFSFT